MTTESTLCIHCLDAWESFLLMQGKSGDLYLDGSGWVRTLQGKSLVMLSCVDMVLRILTIFPNMSLIYHLEICSYVPSCTHKSKTDHPVDRLAYPSPISAP